MTEYWFGGTGQSTLLRRMPPMTANQYRDIMTYLAFALGIGH